MGLASSLSRRVAVLMSLALLTGCAALSPSSTPSSTPITSIEPLVDKWSGTLDQGGPREFFYLTVRPDQTFVATYGINWSNGRITIADGRATYQMSPPPLEGTMQLFDGPRGSTLFMQDRWQTFRAIVTKQ